MMRRFAGLVVLIVVMMMALATFRGEAVAPRIGSPAGGRIAKSDDEWRNELTPEQYRVCRAGGTERAYAGAYWNSKAAGTYACACCGQALFSSAGKYDSGTGWPSFRAPVDEESVSLHSDRSWIMARTEVRCSRCDAHLGHVFADGPAPGGLRYCVNSVALKFMAHE